MNATTFEYVPHALHELQTRLRSAIIAGAKRVVLDLDRLPVLESGETRGLVILLRRSRELGGDITLRVTRPDLKASLAVMALDLVFEIQPAC